MKSPTSPRKRGEVSQTSSPIQLKAIMLYCKLMRHSLCQVLAALMLAMALEPSSRAEAQTAPVDLRILAINDFHGYLQPPPGGIRIADPGDKSKKIAVEALPKGLGHFH